MVLIVVHIEWLILLIFPSEGYRCPEGSAWIVAENHIILPNDNFVKRYMFALSCFVAVMAGAAVYNNRPFLQFRRFAFIYISFRFVDRYQYQDVD